MSCCCPWQPAAARSGKSGVEPDPNAGKYQGISAKALGMTMDMSEVYPGETWGKLKSGGKGTVMLDGDEFPMKWTLDGEALPTWTPMNSFCSS